MFFLCLIFYHLFSQNIVQPPMKELATKIKQLEATLTGDMMKDMETQQKIFDLKRQINEIESPTIKPSDSDFECFGCGS